MSKPLSFRRQVECLIVTLEDEIESMTTRIDEANEEMLPLNEASRIYSLKYGYMDALEFERAELRRILKAAKIAFEEATTLHPS